MSNNIKVLIVGTGYMATEYYKVLSSMNVEVYVVGRGREKAERFKIDNSCENTYWGGVDALDKNIINSITHAIIAVTVSQLKKVTMEVINLGIKEVLVEKPAALTESELNEIKKLADKKCANVYVAYNRRFYASVKRAEEIIKQDGGIKSFSFEFTEWGHVIKDSAHDTMTKENWLLANSSHVIDLAFFFGGKPIKMESYIEGELEWHHNGCIYAGAGITDKGALFSYSANWDAPGRWAVEILTKNHRLYLKPMEELLCQDKGTVKIYSIDLDDSIDKDYKPGLYREVSTFLQNPEDIHLVKLSDQIEAMEYYSKIAGV